VVDEVSRSAAKLAALVAVPVGLLAGILVLVLLGDAFRGPVAEPPATPGPVATGPVITGLRPLGEREETVCRALVSRLPPAIRDLAPRPVTAGAEQNAAFGDPPIIVECGVPAAVFPPTDGVLGLDGVCYHATGPGPGTVWVTVDREVPVRVTVPDGYDGPGQWVAEFSDAIVSTVRTADEIPWGCPG
jgi:hypothetical protein